MSVGRAACTGLVATVLTLWLGAEPVAAQSVPACRFALGGEGLTLTVGVQGSDGLSFRVQWGDGYDSTAQPLTSSRGRAFLRHTYTAAGNYRVRAEAITSENRGCVRDSDVEVPYETSDDETTQAILAGNRGRTSSDELRDVELGPPLAQVPVSSGGSSSPDAPATPSERISAIERVLRGIRSVFGG